MVKVAIAVRLDPRFGPVGLMQYVTENGSSHGWKRDRIEVERDILAKSDDDDPLAVLWSEVSTVNYAVMDVIAEVLQGAANNVERTTLVVRGQVLHVFQQEGAWALLLDDAADIKEQGALRFIVETVRTTKCILYTHTCNREWLAGEASEQYVVVGYTLGLYLGDVARDEVAIMKVLGVGFLRIAIPLACKYALTSYTFEGGTNATDASE